MFFLKKNPSVLTAIRIVYSFLYNYVEQWVRIQKMKAEFLNLKLFWGCWIEGIFKVI